MSTAWSVRELEPSEFTAWNALVAAASEGSPYQTPEYLRALAIATGADWRVLGVYRAGELWGGIGLYEEAGRFGLQASSRLLLYYNGPVIRATPGQPSASEDKHRRDALAHLADYLGDGPYRMIRVKTRAQQLDFRPWLERGWSARPVYTYVVDTRDAAETWRNIDHNLQRLVRRAEYHGITVTEHGDVGAFLAMHRQTHERKGAPIYLAEPQFRQFIESLVADNRARLFQASLPDGRPVAAQLVIFSDHPVTHTVAAAADAEHQHLGSNALLRWRVFQWLATKGYHANDLTDAHQPQVARFKAQLGGRVEMGLQLELRNAHWTRLRQRLKQVAKQLRNGRLSS